MLLSISQADAETLTRFADMKLNWTDGRSDEEKAAAPIHERVFPPMKLRLRISQTHTPNGAIFILDMWQKGVSKAHFIQEVPMTTDLMKETDPEALQEWMVNAINAKAVEMANTLSRGWDYTLMRVS